jgi:very-short-patch-repair endonuclease
MMNTRKVKNYKSLPYNPNLKKKAQELRKSGNLSEVLLWEQIKSKKFHGIDFDRQKIIGHYIVDFYAPNLQLVIEIDGVTHDFKHEYDEKRENYLRSLGLNIIHLLDIDVKKNLDSVLLFLEKHPFLSVNQPPRQAAPATRYVVQSLHSTFRFAQGQRQGAVKNWLSCQFFLWRGISKEDSSPSKIIAEEVGKRVFY